MDLKITKNRLLNVLNYEWVKTIIIIVAIVVGFNLLFTSLGTRLSDGQAFYVVIYDGVNTGVGTGAGFISDLKSDGGAKNGGSVLSYDVLETSITEIKAVGSYSASYMLEIRMSTKEGDVIVVGGGNDQYDGENEDSYGKSAAQSVVSYLQKTDELLNDAYRYTVGNGFIKENSEGYTVDRNEIEKYFRTVRIKSGRNYLNTYTDEEVISKGLESEIERIEAIYINYLSVTGAIKKSQDAGKDFLWYSELVYQDNGEIKTYASGAYGIDLAKLNEGCDKKISDLWYTFTEDGQATTVEGLVFGVMKDKEGT
ncbi:MAG: hypothetical protein IJS67_02100 [Clostridia bacterium]|nr:hypothetical protein [Clostridia bacterium]